MRKPIKISTYAGRQGVGDIHFQVGALPDALEQVIDASGQLAGHLPLGSADLMQRLHYYIEFLIGLVFIDQNSSILNTFCVTRGLTKINGQVIQ